MNETVRVGHKLEREKTIQDHRVSYIVTSKKENITMNEHRRAIVKLNKNILKSAYRDTMKKRGSVVADLLIRFFLCGRYCQNENAAF